MRIAVLSLLMSLSLMFGALSALAHEFKTAEGVLFFDRGAKSFGLKLLNLNMEAYLADIDPALEDTSQSPNYPIYNRLRNLPPDELAAEFEKFKQVMIDGLDIRLDGEPVTPEFIKQTFREIGNLEEARKSDLNFRGEIPEGAETFTFAWDARFGPITILTISANSKAGAHVEIVETGATSSELIIDDLKARTWLDMVWDFIVIGFDHIVPKGLDHILFVVGIFLLSTKWRPILMQVTMFTLAHTVSLALGAMGLIKISPTIFEPLIAASIVYVAVENIWRPTLSPWRPAVVFVFGLLHGLGFAGVLSEFSIPEGYFISSLLSFNVGVELGQLFVIAVCFLLVGWAGNRPWYRNVIVIPGSIGVGIMGLYWLAERTIL